MDIQTVIVLIILAAAIVFVGTMLLRKTRAFSLKGDCTSDCGCNTKAKKLNS